MKAEPGTRVRSLTKGADPAEVRSAQGDAVVGRGPPRAVLPAKRQSAFGGRKLPVLLSLVVHAVALATGYVLVAPPDRPGSRPLTTTLDVRALGAPREPELTIEDEQLSEVVTDTFAEPLPEVEPAEPQQSDDLLEEGWDEAPSTAPPATLDIPLTAVGRRPRRPPPKRAPSQPPAAAPPPAPAFARSKAPPLVVVHAPRPVDYYPRSALRARRTGHVVVQITVGVQGRVTNAHVVTSSGHQDLDRAAIALARAYRFRPVARPRRARIPVVFRRS